MHPASQQANVDLQILPIPEPVAQMAVDWFVELQSAQVSTATRTQWLAWRNAHPDHERAWQRIEAVRGSFGSVSSPVKSTIVRAALSARGSIRRKQTVKVLGVLFFAGTGAWMVEWQTRVLRADFKTAIGQQRTVYLEDGTELVLNTDTAVNLHFSATERRIELVTGEILVSTAKDSRIASRPFLVDAPHGRMRALGTVFSVREQDNATTLAVFDGAVEVWPKRLSGQSTVVHAGEQISFTTTDIMPVSVADIVNIAWKDNMLVVKDMRLDDFLQALGRYSDVAFSCAENVAALRVSGSYPLHNIDTIVEALSVMLGLHVEKTKRFWGGQAIRFGQPIKQTGQVAFKR